MRLRFLAGLLWSAAIASGEAGASTAPSLFDLLSPLPEEHTGVGEGVPPASDDLLAVLRSEAQAGAWRPATRWSLPVPGGSNAVLVMDSIRIAGAGVVEARAHLEGTPGSEVFLAAHGDCVAGIVRRPRVNALQILPLGHGRHRLSKLEPATMPHCGVTPVQGNPTPVRTPPLDVAPRGVETRPDTTNVIDLAVFYTPAAQAGAGGPSGILALIHLALLEANDAYFRSAALLRVQPVYVGQVNYQESGNLALDLDRLGRPADGWMDEIHPLRDQYAADAVCLIVEHEDSNQLAGIANQLRETSSDALSRGFLACVRPYIIGNYTLPHEMGHVLGCDHDRQNSVGGGLEPWSYGTRIMVDGVEFRTIMAYRPGRQFPHFSNPRVSFHGVATGIAEGPDAADNVRTINRTAPLVAAVREPPGRVGFMSAEMEVSESAGSLRIYWQRTGLVAGKVFRIRTLPGSAHEGTDFLPVDRQVSLNSQASSDFIDLTLLDNRVAEGFRQFAVELSEPTSGLAIGPVSTVSITLTDDESEASVALDTSLQTRPGADYLVTSLATTPDGGLLAAGGFTSFNGAPHARIVRLRPDGSADPGFQAEVKYRVNALAMLDGGRIALGGDFNTVNGVQLSHLAVLQADGALDPMFQFDPGTDFPVMAVVQAPNGRLLIGGQFTNVQGAPFRHIARVLSSGNRDETFDPGPGPDDAVLALAIDPQNRILMGGRFLKVGNVSRPSLARLAEDGALDTAFAHDSELNGPVSSLTYDEQGRVIAAGNFTRFRGRDVGRVLRLTSMGDADEEFASGTGADGAVLALASGDNGTIWVAGAFTRFDGRDRRHVARLRSDGSLDPTFDPGVGPNDWVYAVVRWSDESIALGGLFTSVNSVRRGGVAALLATPIRAPEFVQVAAGNTWISWQATVLPRQVYDIEHSDDLRNWEVVGNAQSPQWLSNGNWSGPARQTGFLRLRRRLE